MKKEFERKTVFLYPESSALEYEQLLMTSDLITNINLIVYSANDLIKNILTGGNFSFINCLPTVLMQSICEDNNSFGEDFTNVRICISGFNDIDYTDNYKTIIHNYKNSSFDISHLVAIHITERAPKVRFLIDSKNNFDVIIDTNLENLENVLVAIMLDISLYHYFLLSSNLKERKEFNKYKFEYVLTHYSQQDQEKVYGNRFDKEEPLYLPLSLKAVKALSMRTNKESRSNAVKDLISEYATFLAIMLSKKVIIDEKGNINDANIRQLNHYNEIETIIKSKTSLDNYLIIVPEDLTKSDHPVVLEYDASNEKFDSWIGKENEQFGPYQIIRVQKV